MLIISPRVNLAGDKCLSNIPSNCFFPLRHCVQPGQLASPGLTVDLPGRSPYATALAAGRSFQSVSSGYQAGSDEADQGYAPVHRERSSEQMSNRRHWISVKRQSVEQGNLDEATDGGQFSSVKQGANNTKKIQLPNWLAANRLPSCKSRLLGTRP
uniref:Uncharacterized protein n=1 Tax=Trichuris muris TaxID=70415 RepID=A0A5S6QV41_TRIMR